MIVTTSRSSFSAYSDKYIEQANYNELKCIERSMKVSDDFVNSMHSIQSFAVSSRDCTELSQLSEINSIKRMDIAIHNAYKRNDNQLSRRLHIEKARNYASTQDARKKHDDDTSSHDSAPEKHKLNIGEFMKSIIYGGLDGIITLFAIVASISGSDLPPIVVLALGIGKLVGDGISMGFGDYLSEQAEIDFIKSELKREQREFAHDKQGEINEMIQIYQDKGISKKDAELILNTMAKYPTLFIDHMMMQELGLNASQVNDNPVKSGCVTFGSFLFFGMIPLLSYLALFVRADIDTNWNWTFTITIILTCLTMFGMGAIKAYYNESSIIKSGIFVMSNGCIAAGSAYFIGFLLSDALGIHGQQIPH